MSVHWHKKALGRFREEGIANLLCLEELLSWSLSIIKAVNPGVTIQDQFLDSFLSTYCWENLEPMDMYTWVGVISKKMQMVIDSGRRDQSKDKPKVVKRSKVIWELCLATELSDKKVPLVNIELESLNWAATSVYCLKIDSIMECWAPLFAYLRGSIQDCKQRFLQDTGRCSKAISPANHQGGFSCLSSPPAKANPQAAPSAQLSEW